MYVLVSDTGFNYPEAWIIQTACTSDYIIKNYVIA